MHLRICILLFFRWNVPQLSIKFNWSFKATISLSIFFLGNLYTDGRRLLKSPTYIALQSTFPSISPFMSVGNCFTYLSVPVLDAYMLLLLLLLSRFSCVQLCATPQTAGHQASRLWDSPGKNTGVGCHFLLQCMKVKSEREVTKLCLSLSDPMDCSLSGRLFCPWDFLGKSTGVGCLCLLHIKKYYILLLYLSFIII